METFFKEPKKKKITLTKAKKKAWDACSLYVRMSAADVFGMATCVTCDIRKHYKQMQAGHFVPGRGNAILFDIRGIHVQCFGCNIMKSGNPRKYEKFMKEKYGQKVINELDRLSDTTRKFTVEELLDIAEHYTNLVKRLQTKKSTRELV